MKKSKKILISIVCVLLGAVLIFAGICGMYVPHYKKQDKPVTVKTDAVSAPDIRVMSANLRCWSPDDLGKKSWFYRADLILKNIQLEAPGVIGFQEATKMQYNYLVRNLPQYDSVITYRDNSPFSEGCPVFYDKELFTLQDKGSFWLSETPEVMSKDWGAACYRICSYVILQRKGTEQPFVVFNTHLDHVSDEARIKGIGVVLDKIKQFGDLPAMIIGDLNADEQSKTYADATAHFLDAKYQTDAPDTAATYQHWGEELDAPCIDYALISKTGFSVTDFHVVNRTFDGVYPSDHFPIVITFTLTTQE